jgi:hypothetical protein
MIMKTTRSQELFLVPQLMVEMLVQVNKVMAQRLPLQWGMWQALCLKSLPHLPSPQLNIPLNQLIKAIPTLNRPLHLFLESNQPRVPRHPQLFLVNLKHRAQHLHL